MSKQNKPKRTYNQYCALAKALDVVGQRWTLLLIRELLSGPKRFTDLREGLPGIGTNLLSDRLTFLKDRDIIEQTDLPPPASSTVYRLTEKGNALEDVIRDLQQWGLQLLGEPEDEEHFNPRWALEGILAAFEPELAKDIEKCYEFDIDGEIFHVEIADQSIEGNQGAASEPDLSVKIDSDTFLRITTDNTDPVDAYKNDQYQLEGDLDSFEQFFRFFKL